MTIDLLDAVRAIASAYNISLRKCRESFEGIDEFDFGLRKALAPDFDFKRMGSQIMEDMQTYSFFVAEDVCCYRYAFFRAGDKEVFYMIGPWRQGELPLQRKDYIKSRLGSKARDVICELYKAVPICQEDTFAVAVAQMILLANPNAKIQIDVIVDYPPFRVDAGLMQPTGELFQKCLPAYSTEERYRIEEEIMNAVARSDFEGAQKALKLLKRYDLVNWTNDSLRKIKIHLLILNTLLRKAAERNAVHPYYSTLVFYKYAQQIELLSKETNQDKFIQEMLKDYCNCVQQNSLKQYSPQVQKAVNYIHLNLIEPITLKNVAEVCHVSPSYLSNIFRMETGKTVIEYINERRVYTAAKSLIWDDKKISAIAVQVGFLDVNYFTRIFKKIMGVTPTEYRKLNSRDQK